MAELDIQSDLIERLRAIAQRENRTVDDVITELLAMYDAHQSQADDALEAMDGMFDDDISDLSTTVRETMRTYYENKS